MRTIRASRRCDAAEAWDVVPRVLVGGNGSARPLPCPLCGLRTRHRPLAGLRCNPAAPGNSATLPEDPGPENAGA